MLKWILEGSNGGLAKHVVFPYRAFDIRYDFNMRWYGQEIAKRVWALNIVSSELCENNKHGGKYKDIILYPWYHPKFTLQMTLIYKQQGETKYLL